MKSLRWSATFLCFVGAAWFSSHAHAQSPSTLYTWGNTGDIAAWIRSFGAANTSATLANPPGALTITETSTAVGGSQAFSDGFNRVREAPAGPSGGLDLTGLDYLEFDLGHNGVGNVNVQFYIQTTTGSTFVSLGPDLAVAPGIATYQVPLPITPAQQVYVRTLGISIRDHAAEGNLTWTINEVRSGGVPNTQRTLATFDTGSAEGGLNGAIVNFGNANVVGNDGGQNQTGLSHNPSGSGSLQWTSPAGASGGGAISLGNGTPWNGNSFNNRTTDLSNYGTMHVRMSATETSTSNGGSVGVQAFFQKNNFSSFQSPGTLQLPIDGQFHDLWFTGLNALTFMNVIDQTGLSIFSHADELRFNVDLIEFYEGQVPEPASFALFAVAMAGSLGFVRRARRD